MGQAEHDLLYCNRVRAQAFGQIAELYDRVRPSYPPELMDVLAAGAPDPVLDVGSGTGIVAAQLGERGLRVLGLEPDPRMAAIARRKGIEVEVARLEEWEAGARRFALITAGQSWHWVDPERGAERAAQLLRPGGRIALFWNLGEPEPPLRDELNAVYERLAPHLLDRQTPAGRSEHRGRVAAEALAVHQAFGGIEVRRFPWRERYTTADWLDLLASHSDMVTMEPAVRERLLSGVGQVLAEHGGFLELPYEAVLVTGTVRSPA